ncbi:penicillin-binding protein [Kitasatospora sp. NBC_01287]|uniref:transglycosylase domain-containing protein n=1 Tax=Kitasatospora sp. NBC_01287 TaxID=2903573 RepID=UPI0022506F9B|nr:transglycosylase domain-containing protein [Kitasatospora sp. NBC_01287]MCX4748091.1 penicillin-binding protein [Kitasatospora sp. NBC_01287]
MAPKRSSAPQRPRRRRTSPLELAGHGIKFLGVSILSGVLLAGLALPAVGAIGLGAKDGIQNFDNIPDDFKTPTLSQASYIYDAKGNQIAKVYAGNRDRTILTQDQMSPLTREAQVDIEDARFYQHGAIDPKGVLRAIGKNASSDAASEGASTLTQQYVKNVFVEEAGDDQAAFKAATEKSLGRKIKELKYAIQLEKDLTKDQILTNYLNITFYGHQAYGVEAAAERYFGKSDKDLDVAQAALLAGIVQNPSAYDPMAHPKAAQTRRDTVIDKMLQYKHITAQQAKDAKAAGLELNYQTPQNGCITASSGMAFFCDYVQKVVESDPAFGTSSAARSKLWSQGGLKITTTIDPDKQAAAYSAVTSQVKVTDSVSAAMTMVKPGTGEILAMAQTRPYGLDSGQHQTVVNLNVDAAMGGGNGFQPGSTFKAIVAAAAIDSGSAQLNTSFPSPPQMPYPDMTTCGAPYKNTKHETVSNDSPSESGPFMMPEAMARSINTYFVSLEQSIGLCAVTQMANKLGIKGQASGKPLDPFPSMTLGTELMSPLDMAGVYATFAARGVHCDPIAIKSVTGLDGKQLTVPQGNCQQVMQQNTADSINTLLKGVTEKSGTGAALNLSDNRPIAGKTGTTDGRKAAWFDGYTPDLAGVVWLGGPESSVTMDRNIVIGGHHFYDTDGVYGANGPGPIWQQAMDQALKGTPVSQFTLIQGAPSATASTDTPPPGQTPNPGDPNNPGSPPASPPANPPANPPASNAGLVTSNPVPPITSLPGAPVGGTTGGGFTLPAGLIGGGNGGNSGKPGRPGRH